VQDFGFQVNDRFISGTNFASGVLFACVSDPDNACSYLAATVINGLPDFISVPVTANQALIQTVEPGGAHVDSAFWVIVF
jgi:hypothetical protein